MTIPNVLTLLRLLSTPFIVWLIAEGRLTAAFVLFAVAGVTDGLDGLLARLLRQKSDVGAWLDPLADKVLFVGAFLMLWRVGLIPWWLTAAAVARDLLILFAIAGLRVAGIQVPIRPTILSKINTVVQILVVGLTLASGFAPLPEGGRAALFLVSAALCAASTVQYAVVAARLARRVRA